MHARQRIRGTALGVVAVLGLSACGASPPEGERLDPQVDFLGVLDEGWADAGIDRWQEVRGALVAAPGVSVDLRMPRWEMDASLDLTALLSDLGFDVLRAPDGDLDGILSDASVSRVAQAATITVAERGTVAAAVTQVEVEATSAPLDPAFELVLDHPFEYQVVELRTGLVLFAGRVADPSA